MQNTPLETNYAAMTNDQLDLAIAERLYDVQEARIDDWGRLSGWKRDPRLGIVNAHGFCPTRSASAMLDLIEAMHKRGWWCQLKSPFSDNSDSLWFAGFTPLETTGWNGRPDHSSGAHTAQRAVCEAALTALDAEQEAQRGS